MDKMDKMEMDKLEISVYVAGGEVYRAVGDVEYKKRDQMRVRLGWASDGGLSATTDSKIRPKVYKSTRSLRTSIEDFIGKSFRKSFPKINCYRIHVESVPIAPATTVQPDKIEIGARV
jgi:hypothetical protein